ncbi:hypothetical protein MCEMSE15_00242 [Fimbriimonadaceae bacterium]
MPLGFLIAASCLLISDEVEIVYLGDQKESSARWSELSRYAEKGGILKRAKELNLLHFELEPGLFVIDERKQSVLAQRRARVNLLAKFAEQGTLMATWGEVKKDLSPVLQENYLLVPKMNDRALVKIAPVVRWNFVNSKTLEPGWSEPQTYTTGEEMHKNGPLLIQPDALATDNLSPAQGPAAGWLIANNESEVIYPLDPQKLSNLMALLAEREREEDLNLLKKEKAVVSKLVSSGKLKFDPRSMDAKSFMDLAPELRARYFNSAKDRIDSGQFKSMKDFTEYYTGMRVENMSLRLKISFGVIQTSGMPVTTTIEF